MPEIEAEVPAADAANAGDFDEAVEPADLEGYQRLVEKLRGDVKTLKSSDRKPQDERDKSMIARLTRQIKDAEPKVAEYDRLAEASKTADERAQEAVKAAETRALASMQRVARAEVKAALTGLVDDPNSIVEDLNLARFIDDDGEIDQAAIDKLKAKYEGFSGRRPPRPDQSQASGANGATATSPAAQFASILQSQLGKQE